MFASKTESEIMEVKEKNLIVEMQRFEEQCLFPYRIHGGKADSSICLS